MMMNTRKDKRRGKVFYTQNFVIILDVISLGKLSKYSRTRPSRNLLRKTNERTMTQKNPLLYLQMLSLLLYYFFVYFFFLLYSAM